MKSTVCTNIHRIKYSKGKLTPRKCRETRALLGSRFKILLADTGLNYEEAGKLLHVTPRTIRYWVSGRVAVPYAAYKLVRVMRLFELPCVGWDGWHMHSGRLWSPEGHGFMPSDSTWWGLLVRKARMFTEIYERDSQVNALLHRMKGAGRSVTIPAPDASEAHQGRGGADRPTDAVGRAA